MDVVHPMLARCTRRAEIKYTVHGEAGADDVNEDADLRSLIAGDDDVQDH